MDYIITTEQLTKKYKNFISVNNVSLHIRKGSIYGFLGPNGAGKSTTMKMLLGLTAPTKGSFTIDGKQFPNDRIAILKEIGSFIEAPSFYANLTGRENLDIIRRILGLPKADVEDALELVGLTEFGDRLAKKYSLGMKQRLGLAGALLGRPPILILDEPTNGLDPNQIRQIRELIKGLAANHTIILSTHILSEVEMICNKVIIIDQGTIKAADTPSNLTANLRAAGKITLEFRGDLELITQKLESLEHVKKVIHEGTDADGWHTLTVRAEAGTDTREKAARLLAEQGCPLRHIYRHTPTLEEVFVEMTRKD